VLKNGAAAHEFTREDRAKGGRVRAERMRKRKELRERFDAADLEDLAVAELELLDRALVRLGAGTRAVSGISEGGRTGPLARRRQGPIGSSRWTASTWAGSIASATSGTRSSVHRQPERGANLRRLR
jgi:hypothetical protein